MISLRFFMIFDNFSQIITNLSVFWDLNNWWDYGVFTNLVITINFTGVKMYAKDITKFRNVEENHLLFMTIKY